MKKLNPLLFTSCTSITFAIVCMMCIPVNAGTGYWYVPHSGGGATWGCAAYVEVWFTTPQDTIDYPESQAWHSYWANGDVTATRLGYVHETNTMNIRERVTVRYTSWLDTWDAEAESWSYPQYDPEPTGGYFKVL
ncbi:MAG: hypothetical protein IAX21_11315 [Candidatus Bathyarchaeota archaeon]|nr:MAG: hypothetical protein IAX21_11315 [Candidatus Bathyarchaeota archaeon]